MKPADHPSLQEFERWWTERPVPDIRDEQVPHLVRYIINVRTEDTLVATSETLEWDGIAEEWFSTAAAFDAACGKGSPRRRACRFGHQHGPHPTPVA